MSLRKIFKKNPTLFEWIIDEYPDRELVTKLPTSILNETIKRNPRLARKLIQLGIDINGKDEVGLEPLRVASFFNDECVKFLLERRDLELDFPCLATSRFLAVFCSKKKYYELELALKLKCVGRSKYDFAHALWVVCSAGDKKLLRILLSHPGVDVNCEFGRQTPLAVALKNDRCDDEFKRMLLDRRPR